MKIYLDSIGCRLNQSEIEQFARQFRAAGHILVSGPEDADLAVVNTCAVTAAASADSRKKIRHIARQGNARIVVTGCWSALEPEKASRLPSVETIVSNLDKDNLVMNILGQPADEFDIEPVARQPVPGARLRTRAFIKVQDGCDNRCTFCVTTIARGAGRSRTVNDVLADIQAAIDGGSKEVVLTGVHLGSWGHDFETPSHLTELVLAVLADTDVTRLRLSSLEPWDLSPDFFHLWEDPRLARHIHLPLQSGSRATLRRMARKTTPESFAELVANARQMKPDMAITTDVIAGFPGETEAEYQESLDFISRMRFAGGHVFTYSERKGTAAATMPNQVHHPIRKQRNAQIRDILHKSALDYSARFVGSHTDVLWETAELLGPDIWTLSGLSDNYLRVRAEAPKKMWNQITPVYLTAVADGGMIGRVI